MQEVAVPRTLDSAASVLKDLGDLRSVAFVLGKARTFETSSPALVNREALHEALRTAVIAEFGEDDATALLAEGAAMETDDALALARIALRPDTQG
jgi:hypothetical protein